MVISKSTPDVTDTVNYDVTIRHCIPQAYWKRLILLYFFFGLCIPCLPKYAATPCLVICPQHLTNACASIIMAHDQLNIESTSIVDSIHLTRWIKVIWIGSQVDSRVNARIWIQSGSNPVKNARVNGPLVLCPAPFLRPLRKGSGHQLANSWLCDVMITRT